MVIFKSNLQEVWLKFRQASKNNMPQSTHQTISLHDALQRRGIKCKMEVWDGHKHVDISIPWAMIDIEIDGTQHYTNPEQIMSDFKRSYWSIQRDDYDTFHVPNIMVENHLDQVADALATVARSHYKAIKEENSGFWGWIKKLLNL